MAGPRKKKRKTGLQKGSSKLRGDDRMLLILLSYSASVGMHPLGVICLPPMVSQSNRQLSGSRLVSNPMLPLHC